MKSKVPKQLFKNESAATPIHDGMLLRLQRGSNELRDIVISVLKPRKYDIISIGAWKPEFMIMNHNYYVGSIDLYVEVFGQYKNEDNKQFFKFIIEIKPNIKSHSEAIRQINVYREYLKKIDNSPRIRIACCVITYSNISKFKDIFESQGIELIQLKKEDDSQTNLR